MGGQGGAQPGRGRLTHVLGRLLLLAERAGAREQGHDERAFDRGVLGALDGQADLEGGLRPRARGGDVQREGRPWGGEFERGVGAVVAASAVDVAQSERDPGGPRGGGGQADAGDVLLGGQLEGDASQELVVAVGGEQSVAGAGGGAYEQLDVLAGAGAVACGGEGELVARCAEQLEAPGRGVGAPMRGGDLSAQDVQAVELGLQVQRDGGAPAGVGLRVTQSEGLRGGRKGGGSRVSQSGSKSSRSGVVMRTTQGPSGSHTALATARISTSSRAAAVRKLQRRAVPSSSGGAISSQEDMGSSGSVGRAQSHCASSWPWRQRARAGVGAGSRGQGRP